MRNPQKIGDSYSISLPVDEDGFIGRQCPNQDCKGYFKIAFDTGLPDITDFNCPYCGYTADQSEFHTPEQEEYANSKVLRQIDDAIFQDLKKHETNINPKGDFGIGFSVEISRDKPITIQSYCEKELETIIVCDNCSLRYAVYGVFAYCPSCRQYNSLQILNKDFDVIKKQLQLASKQVVLIKKQLIENSLENCVSSFDGFGRSFCRAYRKKARKPEKVKNISFQNIKKANEIIQKQFGVNITKGLASRDWRHIVLCFQKRHVLVHNKGVIDKDYINKSGDPLAVVGRKVKVTSKEVKELIVILSRLASNFMKEMKSIP